jgi:serine/threonine-protein kinase
LDGASLASYLKPGLAYESRTALPIVSGLLHGLAEAHRQGVVHGDLKPANVFLSPRADGPPLVKILDFGIADVIVAAGGMMTRTRGGTFLGSPAHMSPEQIRGGRDIGPRSDLWSAGVILYQLLTGRDPFPAPNESAKLDLILNSDPVSVDQGKPELSIWRRFFASALARHVEQRFASAKEMHAAMITASEQSGPAVAGGSASITDMSPELPRGRSRNASLRVEVVATPLRPPAPGGTLRAGQVPMLPAPSSQVPVWVAVVVSTLCLAAGFCTGFLVGRL